MVWYSVMWCNDGKAIQVVVSVLGYGTVCEVWWDTVLRGRSKVRPQEKKYGFISPQSERRERRGLSIFLPIVSE